MKTKKNGKLRGEALTKAALELLSTPEKWPPGVPLIAESLAAMFGVSRQAIYDRQSVVEALHAAQKRLEKQTPAFGKTRARREVDDRLKDALSKIIELERQLDSWREKWLEMEKRCQARNLNPSEILGSVLKVPSQQKTDEVS